MAPPKLVENFHLPVKLAAFCQLQLVRMQLTKIPLPLQADYSTQTYQPTNLQQQQPLHNMSLPISSHLIQASKYFASSLFYTCRWIGQHPKLLLNLHNLLLLFLLLLILLLPLLIPPLYLFRLLLPSSHAQNNNNNNNRAKEIKVKNKQAFEESQESQSSSPLSLSFFLSLFACLLLQTLILYLYISFVVANSGSRSLEHTSLLMFHCLAYKANENQMLIHKFYAAKLNQHQFNPDKHMRLQENSFSCQRDSRFGQLKRWKDGQN